MFPFVDGFHWTFGHILFLTVFGSVLAVIAVTLMVSLRRWSTDRKKGAIDGIVWASEFHDLPECERQCRHQLAGRVDHRQCDNTFECGHCAMNPKLANATATASFDLSTYGLDYPADRLYHRGQTWVKKESDGTVIVGLTDLARRVMGRVDKVDLPKPGENVTANGRGWTMSREGVAVRVLAPVSGEVVETGGPDKGYYLRLKPANGTLNTAHLLKGAEISGWVRSQLDRLQILVTPEGSTASLADGGVLVEDLPKAQPEANWDKVCGEMFLEP